MRIATIALVVCCSGALARGQELIPNGSFEQATGCPATEGQIDLADPWIEPTLGSTDYFNPCDTIPDNVGVPDNAVGTQDAFEGSSYAGFIAVSPLPVEPNYREYLQAPLLGGALEAGKTYRFAMHLCLAEKSSAATDRIGAHFSATPISAGDFFPLPFVPQMETPAGSFLAETVEWMTLDDTFVAAGGEQYVTIGNFHDFVDSATVPAGFGPAPPLQLGTGYYYLDVVSLQCQPCLDPPDDLVAWWPLDETAGIVANDIVSALDGLHAGTPTPLPGMVDGALAFAGSGLAVPTAPELELGTGDFSIDAWVRPDVIGPVQAIFAKLPAPLTDPGYGLVLNGDGTVTFTMVDAALGVAMGTSTATLAVGTWSHVTVAVDRDDPTASRIYVDGTGTTFDSTSAPGSLTNALPLRFGQDGGVGLGTDLAGSLDEVELFSRYLFPNEALALYQSRTSGKCKIFLELPTVTVTEVEVTFGDPPTIGTIGTISNGSGVTGTFGVSVRGEPAGTRCGRRRSTADGPLNPIVVSQQPIQVPPGEPVPIRFELDVPRELYRGIACYSVTVTHLETGRTFLSRGVLRPNVVEATMQPR